MRGIMESLVSFKILINTILIIIREHNRPQPTHQAPDSNNFTISE
jgi:hypothetical protein